LIALDLVLLVVLAGAYAVRGTQASDRASAQYQSQLELTRAAVQRARSEGYTNQDLQPVATRLNQLSSNDLSFWPAARMSSYQDRAAGLTDLRGTLQTDLARLLADAKQDVNQQVATATTLNQQNASQGGDVGPLQDRLAQIRSSVGGATSIREVRELGSEAQRVGTEATAEAATLKQENAAIQQGANALLAQTQDVDALRTQANASLVAGRNDASLASYESKAGRFKQIDTLMTAYDRLEFFSGKLAAPDLASVAFGAAAEQRYDGQVHQLLQAGMGPQHVVVSFSQQHVWAFQNGQQVMDTPATTGIRGSTTDGTDFGPMKILHTNHPWTMHSPWPPGNPLYYPDTVVQYASFFTNSGESFHDASWEPDSELGPGSQNNAGTQSHGCVHIPANLASWMYSWVKVGTPVDVYPADGTPVANQLSQMTTDDQGNPLTPA
jgi:lipoprotein-anchoring transpeptidase ErfK/SrfK